MSSEDLTSPHPAVARAQALISATAADPETAVVPAELLALADALPPLDPIELVGEWSATSFNTGHPMHCWLKAINWVGITFRSEDDVEPIVVATPRTDGREVGRRWLVEWGNGEVIEARWRGVVSAAMMCDNHPIINHFRKVSDTVILGIMCGKVYRDVGLFFFYLSR